jgi:DegV family protein with EDD domain
VAAACEQASTDPEQLNQQEFPFTGGSITDKEPNMLIVTDGAVDLPDHLEHSSQLRVVAGQVWLNDKPVSGSADEFWALLRRGTYPSTTPPTVDELAEAYQRTDPVFAIHVSAELSSTMARAIEAAERAGPDVTLIDTRSLSVGAGLIAAAVHRILEDTPDQESIIEFARSLPDRLHTFALIQEVEALRRSDRSGLLPPGHLARHHPLLLAVRGRVVSLGQPKNRAAALKDLVGHTQHSVGKQMGAWALGHGDAADRDALVEQLSRDLHGPPAFVARLDPTVGAHVGPDAVLVGAISGPIAL